MHQIQDIARGAVQPVEPQHDQFVAGVQKLHDRIKFRASAPRSPRSDLGADDFTARSFEAANLDIRILVRGADAGISNAGQEQIHPFVTCRTRHVTLSLSLSQKSLLAKDFCV